MAIPELNPGLDIGLRILRSLRAYVSRTFADVFAQIAELRADLQKTPTLEIMRGEIDVSCGELNAAIENLKASLPQAPKLEDFRALIGSEIEARLPRFEPPKALSPEDCRPMLEAYFAKWELDFDRRADVKLERAIDRMPKPHPGEPGRDGSRFEGFRATQEGRNVTLAIQVDGEVYEQKVRFDYPMGHGLFQAGKRYEKSDVVTYAGSQFMATCDTTGKEMPEKSSAWQLVVKRGRDGKDFTPEDNDQ